MSDSLITIERKKYLPTDFKIGDHVRLYLAWSTNQDIFIRDGVVLNPYNKKSDGFQEGDALEFKVNQIGILERRNPIEVMVFNSDGYLVRGKSSMKKVNKYTRSYFYHCITKFDNLV